MMRLFLDWMRPRGFWDWFAVSVTTTLAGLCAYWAIVDREPIVTLESEIVTPIVAPGGVFSVRYHVRWQSECKVTGYRFIIDAAGQQYTIAPDARYVRPEDEPDFFINIPISESARPGPAFYRATILYECNPLQRLFPLTRVITPVRFLISAQGISASGLPEDCTEEKPVYVRAHCRRRPVRQSSVE